MERCPNCGSSVRAGAKFCTTCGMRLPEAPVTDESAQAANETSGSGKGSPFDSTASVSGSRWPSSPSSSGGDAASGYAMGGTGSTAEPAAPETAEEEQTAESAPEPAQEPGSAWASAGSSSGWNWSGQAAGSDTDEQTATTPEQASSSETAGSAATAQGATTDEGEAAGEPAAETDQTSESTTTDTETAVQVADTGSTGTGVIEETVYQPPVSAVVSTAPAATMPQQPSEEQTRDEQPTAPEESRAYASGGPGTPSAGDTSADLERANHLLDELRTLLPQLASTGPSPAGSDIAATLQNAVASQSERASFESLRAAVAAAQQRPRDIDTMLDISNRLDVIAALDDAYAKLSSAVDDVLSQMQPSEDQ